MYYLIQPLWKLLGHQFLITRLDLKPSRQHPVALKYMIWTLHQLTLNRMKCPPWNCEFRVQSLGKSYQTESLPVWTQHQGLDWSIRSDAENIGYSNVWTPHKKFGNVTFLLQQNHHSAVLPIVVFLPISMGFFVIGHVLKGSVWCFIMHYKCSQQHIMEGSYVMYKNC